jgi:phage baseplate assembly protein W
MEHNDTIQNELPGGGWSFPVGTDHKGDISLSNGQLSIEDSITIILGTAKGERVMRPEFGCDIHEHVFDSINETTITLVNTAVEEALIKWEPRIDVGSVSAQQDPDNPSRLVIDIRYLVRSTNAEANMVYPFYVSK